MEGPKGCFFIVGGIPRIFETTKYVQTHGKRGLNVIILVLYYIQTDKVKVFEAKEVGNHCYSYVECPYLCFVKEGDPF
jgi:hypothetical protein